MSAEILRELAIVKAMFQLRTLEMILRGGAIGMARDSAETLAAPVPQDCQARAEGIAQPKSSHNPRRQYEPGN